MYNPVVCFPVYSHAVFPKAVECIQSLYAGSLKPKHICVTDNSGGDFAIYYRGKDSPNNLPRIEITTFQKGIGLTGTWNYAFERFDKEPYLFLPGDDCVFHHDTLADMVQELETNPDAMIVYPGNVTNPPDKGMAPWSFFVQRKELYDRIGPYDENFLVFFADDDLRYRMQLAGMDISKTVVPVNTTAGHWGSYTVKTATGQVKQTHDKYWHFNEEYYHLKWGNGPHRETHKIAFDGKNGEEITRKLKEKHNING